METFPKVGMTYGQVKDRLIKDSYKYKNNANLRASILYQVQLCEGEKAAHALANEVESTWSFKCSGNKQVGMGSGISCSNDPSFEKVGLGKYRKTY